MKDDAKSYIQKCIGKSSNKKVLIQRPAFFANKKNVLKCKN